MERVITGKMKKKWVSAILLGAGESKRMGRDKLLLPWGKGTVFEHCLEVLLRSETREVVVVVRSRSEEVEDRVSKYPAFMRKKINVVVNLNYSEGMSSSIRKGLRFVDPGSAGVLIALGDQPLLKANTINALIHAFVQGRRKIVIPFYHNKRGNPVLFDRGYLRDLKRVRGDTGGRSIIEKHPNEVVRVRTSSEAVVRDIDIWGEYEKAQDKRRQATGRAQTANQRNRSSRQ
jgi:molybdenum cofactor cytidylyltransferase